MKLTNEEIEYLEATAKTAMLFQIDTLLIDEDGCRGIDDARTVYIRQDVDDIPDLTFGAICLTRIPLFLSRLEIAKTQDNFHVDATLHDDGWVQSLTFKGKGTKIEYRGGNPIKTKVHKTLNDERATSVQLNAEVVRLMKKGQSAMGAELVTLISNDEVSFEFIDVNKDVFSYTFPDKAQSLTAADVTKFAHKYPIKLVLTLFNLDPDGMFTVGGRVGTLCVNVHGMDVYVIPQK